MFWAVMDATAPENAVAGNMANISNFPAMPMAADATTPKELTMAAMKRNDNETVVSCSDTGRPSLNSFFILSWCTLKLFNLKSKTKSRFLRYITDNMRLIP